MLAIPSLREQIALVETTYGVTVDSDMAYARLGVLREVGFDANSDSLRRIISIIPAGADDVSMSAALWHELGHVLNNDMPPPSVIQEQRAWDTGEHELRKHGLSALIDHPNFQRGKAYGLTSYLVAAIVGEVAP